MPPPAAAAACSSARRPLRARAPAPAARSPLRARLPLLGAGRSTPLSDWDLPADNPEFNTRTNDRIEYTGQQVRASSSAARTWPRAGNACTPARMPHACRAAVRAVQQAGAALGGRGAERARASGRAAAPGPPAAQALTAAEIEAMKAEGKGGQEIVAALTAGSATFAAKTEFSQEKYR